jgi:8-oxo-dGTP pyrophosphatase MutT (NUDIX family)
MTDPSAVLSAASLQYEDQKGVRMNTNPGSIRADAFGAVLINAQMQVLLRQPTGQFDGYAWTFAKGRRVAGESPCETALRHILIETGWQAEILADIPDTFASSNSTSKFFLAGRVGNQGGHDVHTAATRWVPFNEATSMIRETRNEGGRERDLAILRAAEGVVARLTAVDRPAACQQDWESAQPLPERRAELAVDLRYGDADMSRIRKGFLPQDMDEKWFFWFGDDVLHLHRSWTGICIYEVRFERMAGGWRATTALVNRDPEQYENTRDDEDRLLLSKMIDVHLLNED